MSAVALSGLLGSELLWRAPKVEAGLLAESAVTCFHCGSAELTIRLGPALHKEARWCRSCGAASFIDVGYLNVWGLVNDSEPISLRPA